MPVHDWTRVDAGLFHDFHQSWTVKLCDALNSSVLPSDHFALIEQNVRAPIPDFLVLKLAADDDVPSQGSMLNVTSTPPKAQRVCRSESSLYCEKANRITVRHQQGDVVSVIEIVSPGNKASRSEFKAFVEKSASLIRQKIHLLVIDVFPPTQRDPQGMAKAIWDEFGDDDIQLSADKPLTLTSVDAGPPQVAYIEMVGVGDSLAEMPLFLEPELYVHAPLEATYQAAWGTFPVPLKGLLETSVRESPDYRNS